MSANAHQNAGGRPEAGSGAANEKFEHSHIQGNILRGYGKPYVRYLILEVAERAAARRWLGASVAGHGEIPQITREQPKQAGKPQTCFNIGLTFDGLRALGTPSASLDMFPNEFIEGMSSRALKLGDVGPSAPKNWAAPFNEPNRIHLVASICADDYAELDRVQHQALADGKAFNLLGMRNGWISQDDHVHFGYRDNIAQPRFAEVHHVGHDLEGRPGRHADGQPVAPLGTVLLGHENNFEGLKWRVPDDVGKNGCFNAFRVLKQDVGAFEKYLDEAAIDLLGHAHGYELLPEGGEVKIGSGLSRHAALREVVAAKMCGRWRSGAPLVCAPDSPGSTGDGSLNQLNDFDYLGEDASRCPHGAHIRRSNPRGGQIVQRVANHSRRLVRRGMPYGPPYDPSKPNQEERGLLGNFLCASLSAQFEAMMYDWINIGLQDPRITGSNDPLVGGNNGRDGWFDVPLKSGATIRLKPMPQFVQTQGGAYTFLPSINAISFLGALSN